MMKKGVFFLFLIVVGCGSKETFQHKFPIPFSEYYYTISDNQTHFVIQFEQPIPDEIELQQLFFRNQNVNIKSLSKVKFEAVFVNSDLILDADSNQESVNQPPINQSKSFQLKPNQAVLEYKQKGITKQYLLSNVEEKLSR